MSRPTVEITEEMETWASWNRLRGGAAVAPVVEGLAGPAVIPPTDDVADGERAGRLRAGRPDGSSDRPGRRGWSMVRVLAVDAEKKYAVLAADKDAWLITPHTHIGGRFYRPGEDTPAPWPWEVAQ